MSASIPSWVVRGAKVVCISDRYHDNFVDDVPRPVCGNVYTIREALVRKGKPQVRLIEIDSGAASFHTNRFRPAVEPKSEAQDVALFKHHLDQRKPVDA